MCLKMAVYEVYSHPELRRYRTHICSKASLVLLFSLALTWVPPLLIGLRSQGFWQRLDTFQEQPNINFKYEILLIIDTSASGDYVTWSTYQNFNMLQMDKLRVPLVKVLEEDTNLDGLNDVMNIQLNIPLMDSEQVYGVKTLLIYDYIISKFAYMEMESAAYLQYTSPVPAASFQVSGDLRLQQKQPVGHKGTDTRYNTSIIDGTSIYAEDFDLAKILSNYGARNLSTMLQNAYPVWVSGRGAGQPFIINATVRYPVEYRILYTPGFWQMIKFGWVQYVALLVVFWFILQRIKIFIFQNQLVNTMVQRPIKDKTG